MSDADGGDNDPRLVRHQSENTLGIYWPEKHVIEFDIGDDREEMHGDYLGDLWIETDQLDAVEMVQADINEIRNQIDSMREGALSEDQKQQLRNMKYKLDAKENTLQIIRELYENEE